MGKLIAVIGLLLLVGCSSSGNKTSVLQDAEAPDVVVQDATPDSPPDVADTGTVDVDAGVDATLDLGTPETDPMIYYGGNVYTTPPNVYFIWYGNWTDQNTAPILQDFVTNLSGSPWLQIVTEYYQQAGGGAPLPEFNQISAGKFNRVKNRNLRLIDASVSDAAPSDAASSDASSDAETDAGPKLYVAGQINFVKSISVGYTYGNSLQDTDIANVVGDAITAKQLPMDLNGIYYVFPSADVAEELQGYSFCYDFCGWHGNYTVLNNNLRIVFVGDTGSCADCNLQQQYQELGHPNSPNGDWSADSMATVVAHELVESMSDPDVNTTPAWFDDQGEETADKCAWVFGTTFVTPNNSLANVTLGQRNFLVQEDFVNAPNGGYCSMTP